MEQRTLRRSFLKKSILSLIGLSFIGRVSKASHAKINAVNGSANLKMNNETLQTIFGLHTTHGNFLDKEIPKEKIETIKDASVRAANSSNMQTYSIIEIYDKDLMRDICGYTGSCMLLFNVDYNRIIESAKHLKLDYYADNITSFITASINTSIAAQTATIAAQSMGIDTLLTNGIHRGDMERLWKFLNLPKEKCLPLIALVLGYANKEPDHQVGRLKENGIFHNEKYTMPTKKDLDAIMRDYDNPDKNIGMNNSWRQDGFDHYQEWFHKVWLERASTPTNKETQLLTQLKKRGFFEG